MPLAHLAIQVARATLHASRGPITEMLLSLALPQAATEARLKRAQSPTGRIAHKRLDELPFPRASKRGPEPIASIASGSRRHRMGMSKMFVTVIIEQCCSATSGLVLGAFGAPTQTAAGPRCKTRPLTTKSSSRDCRLRGKGPRRANDTAQSWRVHNTIFQVRATTINKLGTNSPEQRHVLEARRGSPLSAAARSGPRQARDGPPTISRSAALAATGCLREGQN